MYDYIGIAIEVYIHSNRTNHKMTMTMHVYQKKKKQ